MERDDLDWFMTDDEIVPSSGFTARVMDAVHLEATTPPAIPFPWTRALPGIGRGRGASRCCHCQLLRGRPCWNRTVWPFPRDGFEFNRRE